MVASFIPLAVAALIILDNKRDHGSWLEWEDINNHETLALFLIGVWLGMILR